MTDIIVFSKDRPLQLYNSLESILKFVKGYNKIYILFNYTTDDYLESYHKLNNLKMFSEVVFINEKEYGFKESFVSLLDILEGEHLLMEIDDAFYCDELDLEKYSILFQNIDCGRINFTADYKIYKQDYYVDHGDYLIVDREAILKLPQTNETLCLHYPFNVSSTLHKAVDVSRLMQTEDIKNPFESYIFFHCNIVISLPYIDFNISKFPLCITIFTILLSTLNPNFTNILNILNFDFI